MKVRVYVIDVHLPRWAKWTTAGVAVLAIGLAVRAAVGAVTVPNTFVDGETLSAAKLNASVVPPGTIIAYAAEAVPIGWLACDGQQYNGLDAKYAALYAAIGTAYGGNASSMAFNVPDLRGMFLRGWNNGSGRDADAAERTAIASGGLPGDRVGSCQEDAVAQHTHALAAYRDVAYFQAGTNRGGLSADGPGSGSTTTTGVGSAETRPKNVYVNFIIKH